MLTLFPLVMPPIDDFFAFSGDDFGSPNPEVTHVKKKKKIKKKVKPKVEIVKEKTEDVEEVKTLPIEIEKETVVDTSGIADLLGLSTTTPIAEEIPTKQIINDRHERLKNRHIITENPEEDTFLTSIEDFVNTIREKDSEVKDLIQTYQQSTIFINGEEIHAKNVIFELHVDIHAEGQISGPYDMQVKGNTKIGKIVSKLMHLFNGVAQPPLAESEWDGLVLYVEEINVIFNQSLRCMALLTYQTQLRKSEIVNGFNVHGIITTKENALALYNAAKGKNGKEEEEEDDEGRLYGIVVEDVVRGGKCEMSVVSSMSVAEMLGMYKMKMKLPSELGMRVRFNDKELEMGVPLKFYEILENSVVEVTYSPEEIDKWGNREEEEDEDDDDDDIDIDQPKSDLEVHEIGGNGDEEYFTIFVAGKDKKRYKVRVKPSTKIAEIASFYKSKAALDDSVEVQLLFDDEEMEMDGVVGDTELEDEFMIDAIVK